MVVVISIITQRYHDTAIFLSFPIFSALYFLFDFLRLGSERGKKLPSFEISAGH